MPELKEDQSIVEALRTKTEQEDIRQYLKSTWGGYTKASVLDYLALLRKQQQVTAETFSRNQQALFEEKEALSKSNETLKIKLDRLEAEYRSLSNSIRNPELTEPDGSPGDIAALKGTVAALEEELGRGEVDKSRLEQQLDQQMQITRDYELKLQQTEAEKQSLREMLQTERQESKTQRSTVLRLTGKLEENDVEIKYLHNLLAEGELSALREKAASLTHELESQTEVLSGCNQQNAALTEEIETLNAQCETLQHTIAGLTQNLEQINSQNDRLLLTNQSLSGQLEREYKRSLALIGEKACLIADKLGAVRKAEKAQSKLALMELQTHMQLSSAQAEVSYESAELAQETVDGI